MRSISEAVGQSLDARAASGEATFQAINLSNKLHKDLSDLLSNVVTLAWEACQAGDKLGPILDKVHERAAVITNDLEKSKFNPTPDQTSWLMERFDELTNTLKTRGEPHILDLKKEKYSDSLKVQGGTGYTKRFLYEDWSILDSSFPSSHPIPELKDRVLHLTDTIQALSLNQ